jgi:hypothetical protein
MVEAKNTKGEDDMDIPQETQQEPVQQKPPEPAAPTYTHRDMLWQRKPVYPEDPRLKSPALATFLSLVPGLGQVYVGYYYQGFINIIVVGALICMLAGSRYGMWPLTPLLAFFLVFFWLFNLVDAARRAAFYNQALSGIASAELPREFTLPSRHGSLAGGLLLILIGVIIATNTLFNYSLEWLRHWWPVGLVVAGVYLMVQSVRERAHDHKI